MGIGDNEKAHEEISRRGVSFGKGGGNGLNSLDW